MKYPNKWELQQIAFYHSSDIHFKDVMNLYKKCTTKEYYFLVIDVTLASDNHTIHEESFRKNIKNKHDSWW